MVLKFFNLDFKQNQLYSLESTCSTKYHFFFFFFNVSVVELVLSCCLQVKTFLLQLSTPCNCFLIKLNLCTMFLLGFILCQQTWSVGILIWLSQKRSSGFLQPFNSQPVKGDVVSFTAAGSPPRQLSGTFGVINRAIRPQETSLSKGDLNLFVAVH